jgi:hypothetical protein
MRLNWLLIISWGLVAFLSGLVWFAFIKLFI